MTEKKDCFVICPIGADGSLDRRRSDRVFNHIIKPAAERCGYNALPASEIRGSGHIMSEVLKHVVSAQLVIADLTGGNANVFYELALRHAVGKSVVQILAKKTEKIKYDVSQIRTMRFDIDDVIDNKDLKKRTIDELVDYIQKVEGNALPVETPVSIAGISPLISSLRGESPQPGAPGIENTKPGSSAVGKHAEDALRPLLSLPQAEALPAILKYIKDLTKHGRYHLLESPLEDLSSAIALVNNVPEGGYLSATSSVHYDDDTDKQEGYRTAVNLALERDVKYRKVICASPELWPGRRGEWYEEFRDKADLIEQGKIKPDAFQLLHHPSPMYVDVLISQAPDRQCKELVIGFAAVGGKHGGFRTSDQRMAEEWLNIYLEARIYAEAEEHTKTVLEKGEGCVCLEFLNLLEEARRKAPPPQSAARKARARRGTVNQPRTGG